MLGNRCPSLLRWMCRIAGALVVALPLPATAADDDLSALSLENLMATEVVSAARFARQITDAASAVSVLNARDIQALGLRTLGECLEQMRGLNMTSDGQYTYLTARGFGGPRNLAGRVLLLIDGIPAVDNLYDQLFLGHDSMVDVALIERIEYAPGGGSAMYGNNAFLGVVNVVTRRGRDVDGWETTVAKASNRGHQWRVTGGERLDNGAEWLASVTVHRNDGTPSVDLGDWPVPGVGRAWQWLLKGQWQGWSAQTLGMARSVARDYGDGVSQSWIDGSGFWSVGHDASWGTGWRTTLKVQGGVHRYWVDTVYGEDHERARVKGTWWGLDGQASYGALDGHELVLGLRWRQDPLLSTSYDSTFAGTAQVGTQREAGGVSAEDRIRLRDDLHVTLGLRLDHRPNAGWVSSPRNAVVWTPAQGWAVKWSQGMSHRFASVSEDGFGQQGLTKGERVHSRELGAEYRRNTTRWQATAYHYRMSDLIWADPDIQRFRGRGVELEGEWQADGWRVRGSQAWQQLSDNLGRPFPYSPRHLANLQVSAPLGSERWRLSASLRRIGAMALEPGFRAPSETRLDVTLMATRWLAGLDLRVGVRNVGNNRQHQQDGYFEDGSADGRRSRSGFVELGGNFR